MKFDAHPLAVAVALGLLGPGVLETEDEHEDTEVADGHTRVVEYEPGPMPDPDELHRVEIEWLKTQG